MYSPDGRNAMLAACENYQSYDVSTFNPSPAERTEVPYFRDSRTWLPTRYNQVRNSVNLRCDSR